MNFTCRCLQSCSKKFSCHFLPWQSKKFLCDCLPWHRKEFSCNCLFGNFITCSIASKQAGKSRAGAKTRDCHSFRLFGMICAITGRLKVYILPQASWKITFCHRPAESLHFATSRLEVYISPQAGWKLIWCQGKGLPCDECRTISSHASGLYRCDASLIRRNFASKLDAVKCDARCV